MTVNLSAIASFSNGKKNDKTDGIIPVYGGNGVFDHTGSYNSEDCVIIGRVGAYCGSIYYEPSKCWVSDNAIRCDAIGETDIKYLYYLLKTLKLGQRQIGTSQPLLTQVVLNAIELPYVPDSYTQKQIAILLWQFDKTIKLNQQINGYLAA